MLFIVIAIAFSALVAESKPANICTGQVLSFDLEPGQSNSVPFCGPLDPSHSVFVMQDMTNADHAAKIVVTCNATDASVQEYDRPDAEIYVTSRKSNGQVLLTISEHDNIYDKELKFGDVTIYHSEICVCEFVQLAKKYCISPYQPENAN